MKFFWHRAFGLFLWVTVGFAGFSPGFCRSEDSNITALPSGIIRTPSRELHNLFQLSSNVYSGSVPENESGFARLKALGIKTILSVDGAQPDIKTAHKFGLRYVHLPFGYDGIPPEQALKIIKASREVESPLYVHCHHGIHRGPTAAGIICMANNGWTAAQAIEWLHTAGTDLQFAGLYRSVGEFKVPCEQTLAKIPNLFPEQAKVSALAEVMVRIDQQFDPLKKTFSTGADAENQPLNRKLGENVVQVEELLKELPRTGVVSKRSEDFMKHLREAIQTAGKFRKDFFQDGHIPAEAIHEKNERMAADFRLLSNACSACHKKYRN